MQAPSFTKEKPMLEQVLGLERLRADYQRCSGESVNDDYVLSYEVVTSSWTTAKSSQRAWIGAKLLKCW